MTNEFMKTPAPTGERIKQLLSLGKRLDSRGSEEFRELKIEKNISKKAEGSVRVNLDKTEVIVGVKFEASVPYADSPNKGNLMVTAELSPISSERYESGPPSIKAIEWARVTDRGLRESGFIDFEKLCIVEGEKVWTVMVDIYAINDDGNLMDAAMIGAIAALKIAKLPTYDKEADKVIFELTENSVPLTSRVPYPVSIYKIGKELLVDPTIEEEDFAEARVSTASSKGVISSVQKSNSAPIEAEKMKEIFEMVERVAIKIEEKIEKALKN